MSKNTSQNDTRPQLLERYLDAQPVLHRRFADAMPEDLRVELGDVTMHQLGALHAIARRDRLTMRQLAGCLQATSMSTATQMADRLVKLELVERNHDNDDRRVVCLALTPRARNLFDRLIAVRRGVLADTFAALDDEELATLVSLMERATRVSESNEEIV
jgi:DNA-binding MarR family transcriptional regulator